MYSTLPKWLLFVVGLGESLLHLTLVITFAEDIPVLNATVENVYSRYVNHNLQIVYKYDINTSLIKNINDICIRIVTIVAPHCCSTQSTKEEHIRGALCIDSPLWDEFFEYDSLVRVEVTTEKSFESIRCPTVFIIRQDSSIETIKLPEVEHCSDDVMLYFGARTLCISPEEWLKNISIYVTISTCSLLNVNFSLRVSIKTGYLVTMDNSIIATNVSLSSPVFYRFEFPKDENIQIVRIIANSTSNSSTFLSIQPLKCPIRDRMSNFKSSGRWHVLLHTTSLVVQRDDFAPGFFIIFLPDSNVKVDHLNKNQCENRNDIHATETINFKVVYTKVNLMLALAIPSGIYIIGIVISYLGYSYSHHLYIRGTRDLDRECSPPQICCQMNNGSTELSVKDLVSDRNIYKYLDENSYRNFWTMIIVSLFFVLPISLLILSLYKVLKRTGELDTCDFNYTCAYPLWIFTSFNNIFSTTGFIVLGLTFILFVHKRATKLIIEEVQFVRGNVHPDPGWSCRRLWHFASVQISPTGYGAYQNFGIYYTLGFSMMMAGLLKAFYNTCTNRDTAFFGISFMFVIIILSQIKIYNLRHPCIVTDNFIFGAIAFVLTFSTVGYLVPIPEFEIAVLGLTSVCIQLTILILFCAGYAKRQEPQRYCSATLADEDEPDTDILVNPTTSTNTDNAAGESSTAVLITTPQSLFVHILWNLNIKTLFVPATKQRILWPMFRLLINILVLWYICTQLTSKHFSFRIYVLVLCNFHFDFLYYFVFMKCYYYEYEYKISWQPVIYLILAIVAWGFANWFLFLSVPNWEYPSVFQTQELNKGCIALEFYDHWDLYQLIEAPALFFTFMVMLTSDDALSRNGCEMTNVF